MDEKTTMEITNDRLEEAIQEYIDDRTPERLGTVLNLLRPTKLYVPAMLMAPNQPLPCFLKSNTGEQYLAVYTTKEQIPEEPKSQALLCMPFPSCNSIVMKPELDIVGIVINPFSNNLVLRKELIAKLYEADQKAAKVKQVKMTPEQFHVFAKRQVEFGVLPKRLFTEGEEFVEKICGERETLVNEIFAEAYKATKLYSGTERDYAVMALDIAEDLTLIRIDLPDKGIVPQLCYRVYMTFNPTTKKAGYFTIEKSKEKNVRLLGQVDETGKHTDLGEAPVEGAELQRIMELARYEADGITS